MAHRSRSELLTPTFCSPRATLHPPQELKVDKQSTLILYQGMKEVARLSYKSDDQSIAQFFSHATMSMGAR